MLLILAKSKGYIANLYLASKATTYRLRQHHPAALCLSSIPLPGLFLEGHKQILRMSRRSQT